MRRAGWWLEPRLERDFLAIAAAIRFVSAERHAQPALGAVAAHLGIGPYRLQKLFVRWAGVSPKQFLAHLNLVHARQLLRNRASVLEAALETGLSGGGRLHDLFVSLQGMTPGEYRRLGAGLVIRHAVLPSALGPLLALAAPRGLCGLEFLDPGTDALETALTRARRAWPSSVLVEDRASIEGVLGGLLRAADGAAGEVRLLVRGTRFQLAVWEALLRMPAGRTCSYAELARLIDAPHAARAVGRALACNPVAVLIPCHRVLLGNGALGGYRWGAERKQALLVAESARNEPA
jgi:AraC family transcriptional regulator of adaptative response/methylated-DNA-[protein]-cysteine methyltransferase